MADKAKKRAGKETKTKKDEVSTRPLTILQKRFCLILHGMRHPNQAEALYLAGSKSKGTNLETSASRMSSNVKVKAYLDELSKKAESRAEKKADDIIRELEHLAFSRMDNYLSFGPSGITLKNMDTMTPEQIAAIAEVSETETKEGGSRKFKLHDKRAALVDLGKRFGLFPNKQEVSGPAGKPIPVMIVDFKNIKMKKEDDNTE